MIGKVVTGLGLFVFGVGVMTPVMTLPVMPPLTDMPIDIFTLWPNGAPLLILLATIAFASKLIVRPWLAVPFSLALIGLAGTMFVEDVQQRVLLRPYLGRYWEMMADDPLWKEYSPASLYVIEWGWYCLLNTFDAVDQ